MARPIASQALTHIRVLDLTRVRSGPTCCRVFADFGADVVQIEAPPGVDPNAGMSGARDGFDMLNLHRNKRSILLNLKEPEGREVFLRLVATADVVVENFRPDVKERMGIGYDVLSGVNPRIILTSISGFGETGPYRKRAGFDQIAQGMGGLMWVTGHAGQGPMRAGTAVADLSAGIYAALGTLVALAERERSGRGQWVTTSLLAAQIALMDFQAARYLVDAEVPGQAGNDHPHTTPTGVFSTSDGYINLGIAGEGQWRTFCSVIGEPALATHPDYATQPDRYRNRPKLREELERVLTARTSAEWLERLEAAGIPAGPIYKLDEVFADPQVQHLGLAVEGRHPNRGPVRLVGQPVALSRTPPGVVSMIAESGAHTDEVLGEAGVTPEERAGLRARGII